MAWASCFDFVILFKTIFIQGQIWMTIFGRIWSISCVHQREPHTIVPFHKQKLNSVWMPVDTINLRRFLFKTFIFHLSRQCFLVLHSICIFTISTSHGCIVWFDDICYKVTPFFPFVFFFSFCKTEWQSLARVQSCCSPRGSKKKGILAKWGKILY